MHNVKNSAYLGYLGMIGDHDDWGGFLAPNWDFLGIPNVCKNFNEKEVGDE